MTVQQYTSLVQEAADENTPQERLEELAVRSIELRRTIASNPTASSQLLAKLAQRKDAVTRQNVTANPNTSKEDLLRLVKKFPEQFLQNPIIPLLVSENPNFFSEIPSEGLKSLLSYSLKQASRDRRANKSESTVAEFCLQQLIKCKNSSLTYCIASSVQTPISILTMLASEQEIYTRAYVAQNISTPISLLEKLADDEEPYVKSKVAENINTSVYILEKLADDEDLDVKRGVARNLRTPLHLLEKLVNNDKDGLVSTIVVWNPNTPTCILDKIIEKFNNHNEYAIVSIATKLNIPEHIFEKLALDERFNVRHALVSNQNLPANILRKIARMSNDDRNILIAIAHNTNTPEDVLSVLAQDRRKTIRRVAIKNLKQRKNVN